MLRLLLGASLVASALAGCRISLDDSGNTGDEPTCKELMSSASCVAAEGMDHPTLGWIENNIFQGQCTGSGCHTGTGIDAAAKLDLRVGKSFAQIVNKSSRLDPTRKFIVPNDIHASYLVFMLHAYAPAEAMPPAEVPDVGYMPKDSDSLCCQKIRAVERWVMDGAPSN